MSADTKNTKCCQNNRFSVLHRGVHRTAVRKPRMFEYIFHRNSVLWFWFNHATNQVSRFFRHVKAPTRNRMFFAIRSGFHSFLKQK